MADAKGGFVKLWRKLEGHPVMQDSRCLQLLLKLWLKASYQDGSYHCIFNDRERYLSRGQIFFSRREWADFFSRGYDGRISPKTVERALIRLSEKYQITARETARDGTIVTLLNWDRYQMHEDDKRPATRPAYGPPTAHNQERKNEKKKDFASQAPKIEIHNHITTNTQMPTTVTSSQKPSSDELESGPGPEWFELKSRLPKTVGLN